MSRRRACIAIAVLTMIIALSLPASANLYAKPVNGVLPGFGTNNTIVTPDLPSQAQKDEALRIAATSPLCSQYNTYPSESWSCTWAADPPDHHTVLVSTMLSDNTYLDITVDLNTGSIVSATDSQPLGYSNDVSEFTTPGSSILSAPSMFTSMPSLGNAKGLNIFNSNALANNAVWGGPQDHQNPIIVNSSGKTTLGLSQPFNMFSSSLSPFPSIGSGTQLFNMGGI